MTDAGPLALVWDLFPPDVKLAVGTALPVKLRVNRAAGTTGALVETVEPFSGAATAGITRGDVIIEVNRQPVRSAEEAAKLLRAVGTGQTAFVLLNRRGNQVFVKMQRD